MVTENTLTSCVKVIFERNILYKKHVSLLLRKITKKENTKLSVNHPQRNFFVDLCPNAGGVYAVLSVESCLTKKKLE